ncbi:MAG: hypothetical protein J6125_00210 [Clostridia bacterium]|nr:hypothetical protein [Clostridia bacterium]
MTLSQLRENVALLGFEHELSAIDETAEAHFLFAAERALWQLARLRPLSGAAEVVCASPENRLTDRSARHRGGCDLCVTGEDVRAYTFRVEGTGVCTVTAGDGSTRTHSWQGETDRRFCALVPRGRVTLVFGGDYDYTVTRMALWGSVSSPRAEDVEEGDETYTYDPCQKIEDFWKISADQPTPFPVGVTVEDEQRFRIPRDLAGRFSFRYDRRPPPLSRDTTTIEADEETVRYLPLLVAAELCLDDDAEKSAYYQQQFNAACARLSRTRRVGAPVAWRSSNGW